MDRYQIVQLLGPWTHRHGPLYQRLTRAFEQIIRSGELPPGTILPAERWLARHLGVSRNTIVAAYALLQEGEWVESRRGSGTRISTLAALRSRQLHQEQLAPLAHSPVIDAYLGKLSDVIDLSTGAPSWPSGFDQDICTISPADIDDCLMEYGYAPQGLLPLRQTIAQWYSSNGLPTTSEQILVTTGAQQAIHLLATLLCRHGDTVILENPTFFGAIDAFRVAGARLLTVPIESEGINVKCLREQTVISTVQCIYLIPTFHNPTGVTMTDTQRRQVIKLAQESQIVVIDDMTMAYNVLDREPPPPLAAYVGDESVITIGSLSKLFWAGLRVGWIRASTTWIERLARLKAVGDLGSSLISQLIAVRLIPHIDQVKQLRRRELGQRREIVMDLLRERAPSWQWQQPPGGLFIWVQLPGTDTRELAQEALRCNIKITPGTILSVDGSHADWLRLPFLLPPLELQEGVRRLVAIWERTHAKTQAPLAAGQIGFTG
jgi:DNA-binding transcriptional MocR family regulator